MTFKEIQKQLKEAKNERSVMQHLLDHLDSEFGGSNPRKVLLGEDKLPIPPEAFEAVASDLLAGIGNLNGKILEIELSTVIKTKEE